MGKKKYIKNSKGVTMSVTTDTLGLEKPLLNENYDIDVHNRNMDKIDEDLKPIDDSYIIELFQHDGDTTSPRDYYTKEEADNKFASKEDLNNIDLSNLATKEEANNALNKANEALQAGSNVKQSLVDKLTSEGLDVSTNNTFEELISGIALGKKWANGTITVASDITNVTFLDSSTSYSIFYKKITDLGFIPSLVVAIADLGNSTGCFSMYCLIGNQKRYYSNNLASYKAASSGLTLVFKESGALQCDSTGVTLPFASGGTDYTWLAFE